MLKRRIKGLILEAGARARAANAWMRMWKVADGDYLLPFDVYHSTLQPALSSSFADEADQFGEATALRWSRDGCGIAAIKSAITTLKRIHEPGFSLPSISALAQEMVDRRAYIDKIGWTHAGLAQLARENGLYAENYVGERPIALCARLLDAQVPVVSVTLYFRGGQPSGSDATDKLRPKGGHLVVLKGFRWADGRCVGFFVDDSQHTSLVEGRSSDEFVEISAFEASYSMKVIYVKRGK